MLKKLLSSFLVAATVVASLVSFFDFEIPIAAAAGATQSTQKGQNLTTYSEQIDNANWNKTNITVEANTSTSPLGDMTADAIRGNTTVGQHRTYIGTPAVLTLGRKVTFSIFAKAGSKNWLLLQVNDNISATGVNFDLTNGVKGTIGTSVLTSTITPVGGGWFRCSVTFANNVATSLSMSAGMESANGVETFAGTAADTMYFWGSQVEQDNFLHAYNRVLTANVGSANNTIGGAMQSSLKGQNLVTHSETLASWSPTAATVTDNSASTTAPNGRFTASTIAETVANSVHVTNIGTGINALGNQPWVYCVHMKDGNRQFALLRIGTTIGYQADFDLVAGTVTSVTQETPVKATITREPNGWFRACMFLTTNENTQITTQIALSNVSTGYNTYVGDPTKFIYIWGATLVRGRSPGAYNPTVATTLNSTFNPAGAKQSNQLGQNGLKQSEQIDLSPWAYNFLTIGANSTTAPNGTMTAEAIIEDTTTNHRQAAQTYTVTTFGPKTTFSVFAKAASRNFVWLAADAGATIANFNVSTCTLGTVPSGASATAVKWPNGWCRISVTQGKPATTSVYLGVEAADNAITYLGTGVTAAYAWGAQVEQNDHATAYNHTVASSINP